MQKLLEFARQRGDVWIERKLIRPEDVAQELTINPQDAKYITTFAIGVEDITKSAQADLPRLFESAEKEGDLFFDFDSPNLDKAKEDCKRVYEYLVTSLGVLPDSIKVYYSGSKGYHLLVDWNVLGLSPRRDLHSLYRKLAGGVSSAYSPNHTLDLKIYNARRLFRIPGTVHQKTGKPKVRMDESFNERTDDAYVSAPVCTSLNEAILKIEIREEEKLKQTNRLPKEFFHEPLDCIIDAMNGGVAEGNRNDAVYTIALYWKALGQDKREIYEMIEKSGLVTVSKIDLREISRTITSAFNSDRKFGLKDNVLDAYITSKDRERWKNARIDEEYESLSSVVDSLIRAIENPKTQLAKYHVEELDKRLGGIIGGELVVLGGGTGTGKSEFAFHVAYENAKRGVPTAFISLELSNRDFVARLIRAYSNVNPESFWSGELTKEEKDTINQIADDIRKENYPLFFRKKKAMLSTEELESIVSSLIIEQQCRLIVIDHLHYMGGRSGNEMENQHISNCIRAINGICLKYNIGIITIAHFRKLPNNSHKPSMHEFRDTSSIEQEASTVLLMWRDMDGIGDQQNITEFRLAKSRKDIPLTTVTTRFNKSSRQYEHL